MRVRYLGEHYAAAGRGAADAPWRRGEVRDLPDDIGRYLLFSFPGLFESAEASDVVTPAVAAPPVDRAMRSGRAGGRPVT